MIKKCTRNIFIATFFIILLVSFLFISGCSSTESPPETIVLDSVYDRKEIFLDEKFSSICDFTFYDNLYLCGQINGYVTFALFDAAAISYQPTDIPAPAIGFCKSDDNYIVITSLFDYISQASSYQIHLVSEQGTTLSNFTIPLIINDNDKIHTFVINQTICVTDSEKCISVDASSGAYDILFYFDSYGDLLDFSYNNSTALFLFKNLYGENICYTLDGTLTLNVLSLGNSHFLNTATSVFSSSESISYICNSIGIYQTSPQEQVLLNWANSCIDFSGISDILFIDASTLYILYRPSTNKPLSLFLLTPTSNSSTQERVIVRVSYYESGSRIIPQAALQFNSSSTKYYIVPEERASVFTESYNQSISMLSSFDKDILSNDIGDVVVLNTDFRQYADKGIFCNLYDFISTDSAIHKENFFQCVLESLEYNDSLFVITPYFRIKTLVAKNADFFPLPWNCSNFISFSNSLCEPSQLLSSMSRGNLTDILCRFGISSFIDFENTSCDFKNSSFSDILDFLYALPDTVTLAHSISDCTPYQDNTYLLYYATICNIADFLSLKVRFGYTNSLAFLGFPSNQGGLAHIEHQDYYAISEHSNVKEGAWEFIKFLLSNCTSHSNSVSSSYIPSLNTDPFDNWCSQQQKYSYLFDDGATYTAIDLQTSASLSALNISQELIAEFVSILNSTKAIQPLPAGISEIIEEELSLFFSGQNTSDKTTDFIQNRVQLFLNEKE